MIGTGAAILGSALIGGAVSAYGANKTVKAQNAATKAQADAANTAIINNNAATEKATGLITSSYDTAKTATGQAYDNLNPWREVGLSALASLASVHGFQLPDELKGLAPGGAMGGFWESPDYKLRVAEGTKAITANAAARGMLDSGATGKALINYGQEQGSKEFGNWYNRLAGVVGLGQTATQQSNNILMGGATADLNYGNTIANLTVGNANNNGLITLNQGNTEGKGIIDNGKTQSSLIGTLGGIASGVINNWPGGGGGGGQTVTGTQNLGLPDVRLPKQDWRAYA